MNPHAKFDYPIPGSFAVRDEGVTWNNSFYAFRPIPDNGFSRTDLAELAGLHPRSIKRIEGKSRTLAAGRRSINRRVLFYSVDATISFFDEKEMRIDLSVAISLGLPLGALRPDRFGFRARGSNPLHSNRDGLFPFPVGLAQRVTAAWETWREVYCGRNFHAAAMPPLTNPALPQHTALALAAFTDATLPRARLIDWARKSGHSSKHVEHQVADIARILRERLNTTEGQLLLALLFRPIDVPTREEGCNRARTAEPRTRAAS